MLEAVEPASGMATAAPVAAGGPRQVSADAASGAVAAIARVAAATIEIRVARLIDGLRRAPPPRAGARPPTSGRMCDLDVEIGGAQLATVAR